MTDLKAAQRHQTHDKRNAQHDKDAVSRAAVARLVSLPEYQRAQTAMWYVDCRSELRTRGALAEALTGDQRLAVPFCTTDERGQNQLGLWWLHDLHELAPGKWQILEPPRDRWHEPSRVIEPRELDIVVVPGVAFSRAGDRLGNGQGYYDRLLQQVRADCQLIGLCFECQLLDDLLVEPHDVGMHKVVTENGIYA